MRASAVAVCAALAGCASPVPVAENFPLSTQRVAHTAAHWDVVASDVVAQTASVLQSNPTLKGRAVIVGGGYRATAFNAAFRNFLTNHMVNSGLLVNVCSYGNVVRSGFITDAAEVQVQYEVQLIQHASMPHYRPGMLTSLAAGVVVGRAIAVSHFDGTEGSLLGLGLAGLADVALGHAARATRSEIIVTTTIAEQNRYVMRRSDIYYVPDGDAQLFVARYNAPTPCPTVAGTPGPRSEEGARQEMHAEAMRRSNPLWRPE